MNEEIERIKEAVNAVSYPYAVNQMIASYWYRKAYEGVAPESSVPSNKFALKRAEFFTRSANETFGRDEDREKYHYAYKIWRDNGFQFQYFRFVAHFLGWRLGE